MTDANPKNQVPFATKQQDRLVSREHPYFPVSNQIFDELHAAKMKPHGYIVYSLLLRLAGRGDTAFPGFAFIATKTGQTRRNAIIQINRLINLGYISRTTLGTKGSEHNIYTILPLPYSEPHSPPSEPYSPPSEPYSLPSERHSLASEPYSLPSERRSPNKEIYTNKQLQKHNYKELPPTPSFFSSSASGESDQRREKKNNESEYCLENNEPGLKQHDYTYQVTDHSTKPGSLFLASAPADGPIQNSSTSGNRETDTLLPSTKSSGDKSSAPPVTDAFFGIKMTPQKMGQALSQHAAQVNTSQQDTKPAPFFQGNVYGRINPIKGCLRSCAADEWMEDNSNPLPIFKQWLYAARLAAQKGREERSCGFTPTLANAAAEIRNDRARAADLWAEFKAEMQHRVEVFNLRVSNGTTIADSEWEEIRALAPYSHERLAEKLLSATTCDESCDSTKIDSLSALPSLPQRVHPPQSLSALPSLPQRVHPPQSFWQSVTSKLSMRASASRQQEPTNSLEKYRSWLHSGEPALRKEAAQIIMRRSDLQPFFDEEGNVIDFEVQS